MSENTNMLAGITDFENRVAFVTGGARGIGLGVAKALLRRGAKVAIADISTEALDAVTQELAEAGDRVRTYQLNVTDRDQYASVAAKVADDLGTVSLLFNVAGVADSVSPSKISFEMWDHVIGINLHGVYNGIQLFLPGMISFSERAHIVNVSSEAGLVVAGSGFLYHTSKYAVMRLSESMRQELSHHNIGVSVLFPGPVSTEIMRNSKGIRTTDVDAHSARVTQILEQMHDQLQEEGATPEGVGELVLDAVERNELFIATRHGDLGEVLAEREASVRSAMKHAESFLAEHEAKLT